MSPVTKAREMFKGATSFSQNLCKREDIFLSSNATDIFVDSGCSCNRGPRVILRLYIIKAPLNASFPVRCGPAASAPAPGMLS
ncbi:hypothetical protein QTG54_014987 [Skeletonema marinoi]|uniref:Uncharacterized protein n=1 Tax=Skeletonema marinoi TaxID=267567 RepID=A0AAD9D616_9STRA|nr:hypothetical protein QTG54_014987 [Skeletonema marinoi]